MNNFYFEIGANIIPHYWYFMLSTGTPLIQTEDIPGFSHSLWRNKYGTSIIPLPLPSTDSSIHHSSTFF
jgi:hypothetical protein